MTLLSNFFCNGDTIRMGREIQCLLCVGFFLNVPVLKGDSIVGHHIGLNWMHPDRSSWLNLSVNGWIPWPISEHSCQAFFNKRHGRFHIGLPKMHGQFHMRHCELAHQSQSQNCTSFTFVNTLFFCFVPKYLGIPVLTKYFFKKFSFWHEVGLNFCYFTLTFGHFYTQNTCTFSLKPFHLANSFHLQP